MTDDAPTSADLVTVESDGRIFSGVGVTPESLAETMDAREPAETPNTAEPTPKAAEPAAEEVRTTPNDAESTLERNEDGTFKKSRGAKRFAAMKAEQLKIDEARAAAEAKAAALEARIAEMERRQAPEPPKAEPAPTFDEPEPTLEQFMDQADPYGAHWRALAAYDRRKERFEQGGGDLDAKIAARFQEQTQQQQFVEHVNGVIGKGLETYPDWKASVEQGPIASFKFPPDTYRAILEDENAHHLVYTLSKDPALARKIADERDPLRLGRLLGSVRPPERVARPASTPRAVASSAPTPYQPVGTGSKTTTPSASDLASSGDDYDTSGYRERRAAERRGARR